MTLPSNLLRLKLTTHEHLLKLRRLKLKLPHGAEIKSAAALISGLLVAASLGAATKFGELIADRFVKPLVAEEPPIARPVRGKRDLF